MFNKYALKIWKVKIIKQLRKLTFSYPHFEPFKDFYSHTNQYKFQNLNLRFSRFWSKYANLVLPEAQKLLDLLYEIDKKF